MRADAEEDVAVAAAAGADLAGFVLAPESPRAASDVLPVPDELLAVAVWVGEAGTSGAPIDQARTGGGPRTGAERRPPARGRAGHRLLDLPWQEEDPEHWERAAAEPGRIVLAGKLAADSSSRPRSSGSVRGRSTRPRGSSPHPGSRIRRRCAHSSRPPVPETYGAYGGRYVPRRWIPALDELSAAWEVGTADELRAELDEPRAWRRPPDAAHARGALRAGQAVT